MATAPSKNVPETLQPDYHRRHHDFRNAPTFSLGKTATDANEHRLFISTSVVPDVHERWFSEFTLLDRSTSIDFSPIFHEAKECNQCGTINFFDANNFLMDLGALSPPFYHVSCSCDATT